ncbi:unnamed protein product [Caenorhabditis auriculariae]|uniref:GDP-Man:Man(3)GlcNAc(2)-PP-Dol alpha-1,2-mannosyltransferase n=1 Tax=Caenorhabditis auriculariae TaxID=2777116 RepID=A0A8S1GZ00_9PELO|nr:unnamed protein product [Caenorhabditis auriculariae]
MGLFTFLCLFVLLLCVAGVFFRSKRKNGIIAFFHPYCNAGGGGERASKEQILLKAHQRFGIDLDPARIHFIKLRLRRIVEADLYPRLTMLGQAIGGGILALEALFKLNPEAVIDSMGYPLSLPVFKLFGGAKVATYVHYPTISCDMIELVETRRFSFNNSQLIVDSTMLTYIKVLYYRIFRLFAIGWLAEQPTASWSMGAGPSITSRRFGDVATSISCFRLAMSASFSPWNRSPRNCSLQAKFYEFWRLAKFARRKIIDSSIEVRLCIAGGCRDRDDEKRVGELKKYAEQLDVTSRLDWKLNVPYDELVEEMSKSMISLHTMHNEHFGISVVEGLAAGMITLANDSGGPQMDIVKDLDGHSTGYLAKTKEEYCHAIAKIIREPRQIRDEIRKSARKSSDRFSEERFEKEWLRVMKGFLNQESSSHSSHSSRSSTR